MFLEFTFIILIATLLGLLVRMLRLPLILAYIFTGILISPLTLIQQTSLQFFETLSALGIAFLLFLVGLEMKLGELQTIGKTALLTGLGQVTFTFLVGFLAAHKLFGFGVIASVYLAIGLSFSSTIIIVKLLSEKKELSSLYGRISVGFLLVQDLLAILALLILASFTQNQAFSWLTLAVIFAKGATFFAAALFTARFLTEKIFRLFAKNSELTLLAAVSWALLWSATAQALGFPLVVGAFLAGLALSNSFFNLNIAAKIKPLRDFLIIVFFVTLGLSMTFTNFSANLPAILFFSLLVLIGNPLVLLLIMGKFLGHKKHTAFLAGLTVSQISEFSLIVAVAGFKLGHLRSEEVALLTVVAVVTITLSSYMIQEGDCLYQWLSPYLGVFERKRKSRKQKAKKIKESKMAGSGHVVLVGAHRMGSEFLRQFQKMKLPTLVVDFDPRVVERLEQQAKGKRRKGGGLVAVYGDISDVELLEELYLDKADLLVSTVPNLEDNLFLLEKAKGINPNLPVIVTADQTWEARKLREEGAYFVILPQIIAGFAVAHFLEDVLGHAKMEKLKEPTRNREGRKKKGGKND